MTNMKGSPPKNLFLIFLTYILPLFNYFNGVCGSREVGFNTFNAFMAYVLVS